jgi:transcriptional regulator with XRE-family HTH domain
MMWAMIRPVDPLLRTIGLAIRGLRRERGLSQEALAGLAQIDRSYMSSIERGLRNVSVLNVARIAMALDVPVRDLLGPREVARPHVRRTVAAGGRPELADAVGDHWAPGRYLSLS